MFRNPIATKVNGSTVRKVSSVGLLVAGAVGVSPWLRASGPCTAGNGSDTACWFKCELLNQNVNYCWIGNSGTVYCGCS